jgi:hypothetical protein
MRALVTDVRKEKLLRFDSMANRNVPTLMVVTEVQFWTDAGELAHSQTYACLPEEVDPAYPQRQADSMQSDVDHALRIRSQEADRREQESAADMAVANLRQHHKLSLGDSVKLEDIRK